MPFNRKLSEDIAWQGQPGAYWIAPTNWTFHRLPQADEVATFSTHADIVLSEDQSVAGLYCFASSFGGEIAGGDTNPKLTVGSKGIVNYGTRQEISVELVIADGLSTPFPIHSYKNGRTLLRGILDMNQQDIEVKGAGITTIREAFSGGTFYIGKADRGTLHVDGVLACDEGSVGTTFGGIGTVFLIGTNRRWECRNIHVGTAGKGTITVGGGAVLSIETDAVIGGEGRGTGELVLKGGHCRTDRITVGAKGQGIVRISEGSTMHSRFVRLGLWEGSKGTVYLDRASHWAIAGGLVVGGAGVGELYLNDHTEVGGNGVMVGSTGTICGNDAILTTTLLQGRGNIHVDRFTVEQSGNSNYDGVLCDYDNSRGRFIKAGVGALTLTADNTYRGETVIHEGTLRLAGTNATSGYKIGRGATLHIDSDRLELDSKQSIKGTGTLVGSLINSAGMVAPGNTVGALTIKGDYIQKQSGALCIDIASDTDFSMLTISGAAALHGGGIRVTIHSGFTPTPGQYFDIIITGNGIKGTKDIAITEGWTFTNVGDSGRLIFTGTK